MNEIQREKEILLTELQEAALDAWPDYIEMIKKLGISVIKKTPELLPSEPAELVIKIVHSIEKRYREEFEDVTKELKKAKETSRH